MGARRSAFDGLGGYFVSLREGGNKRYVSVDGDFFIFHADPRDAGPIEPEAVPRAVESAIEMYEPEKIIIERHRVI